jgi:nitrogenase subunit NifH
MQQPTAGVTFKMKEIKPVKKIKTGPLSIRKQNIKNLETWNSVQQSRTTKNTVLEHLRTMNVLENHKKLAVAKRSELKCKLGKWDEFKCARSKV